MTLLSPWTGLAVAAIAIPLLLLLYFLKLRRQERKISSTLLWKKAIQDLQVNAPFQKLRRNLLLFLQLLILAAVLFGIANPIANLMRRPERNIILLVDRSGSMRTVEEDGHTRLEHAQDAAVQFVKDLPDASRAMVVSFADAPSVVCTFTDDKRRLTRLIREIEPTDSSSLLGEALPLAIAYSSNLVEVVGAAGAAVPDAALQGAADIELFSDGRIADADRQYVTRGQMRYYRIGAATDNVGITAFDVRRDFERPGMLSIFVQVENFGNTAVKTDLSLLLDGKLLSGPGAVREVSLGPARITTTQGAASTPAVDGGLSSGQNVVFEFQHEAGGVIEVQLHHKDALAIDNAVFAPIEPPRPTRVLAVSDRWQIRGAIKKLADALSIEGFELMTPGEYESAPENKLTDSGRSIHDLVILDQHDTQRLPPGNYLFFGGLPKIEGVSAGKEIEGQPLVYGRQDHPLLRNFNFDNLFVARWKRLTLPSHATGLLEGQDSVVMALMTDPGHHYVIGGFDLLESNFIFTEAFPIFFQNALGYLASGGLVDTHRLVRPGQTLTIPVPPGATHVRIHRPDGHTDEQEIAGGQSRVTYAKTREVGVFEATFDDSANSKELYAVNLLDAGESRIVPNPEFTVGSEKVAAVTGEAKVNEPLWPYAAAAALLILVLEWWVYNKRVMV
jgi:hypothetical protein